MKRLILGVIGLAGCLTGCASLNSSFDCKATAGVRCTPLSEVNRDIDTGKLAPLQSNKNKQLPKRSTRKKAIWQQPTPFPIAHSQNPPLREPETVLQVWFAPYEDAENHYHQQSIVNMVVVPGSWFDTSDLNRGPK